MKQLLLCLALLFSAGCCGYSKSDAPVKPGKTKGTKVVGTTAFFAGGLGDWEPINFGGEGDVLHKDGQLTLDYGNPLTGVIYTGKIEDVFGKDLENYAITLEAQRVEGTDMFLGLTFPVGRVGHVSLVLGGWAGAITGLSNLDGLNASENDTTKFMAFEDKRWYGVKVLVTPEKIECWLDDKQLVDVKRADYKAYTTHGAVIDTVPFGIFTYGTWAAYRNMKVWRLE